MASRGSLVEAESPSHLGALVTANLQALGLLVDLVKGKGGQTRVQLRHSLTQETGEDKVISLCHFPLITTLSFS